MEAALSTLEQCIDRCPVEHWHQAHGDAPFSQVVFHTLFFTDYYLCRDPEELRAQPFHLEHGGAFGDYEELQWREPTNTYERVFCREYLEFCLRKCASIREESDHTLQGPSGFENRPMPRLELYLYLIRHIQHHAAQLGLRLQLIDGEELRWVSQGR
jgi:hypothetical protein